MSNEVKFKLERYLYNEDSPILILGGDLYKTDEETNYIRLQFANLGKNVINEVKVRLKLYENDLTMYVTDKEYTYSNLNCSRGKNFGDDDLIPIKEVEVDSFKIEIISVEFADNSITRDTISEWNSMNFYNKIENAYSNEKAIEQYQKEFGPKAKYEYKKQSDLWQCACGCVNYADEPICYNCSVSKRELENVDETYFVDKAEEDSKKQKLAETNKQVQTKKKKRKKIVLIASAIALVVVAIVVGILVNVNVIVPKNKYEDAKKYLEQNNFEEAYSLFGELGDYKDSSEQMIICKYRELLYYIENNDFEKADMLLNAFKNDQKYAQYVDECTTKYKYAKGKASFEDGDYKAAITMLNQVKDYEDAEDIINDSKYQYVVENKSELTDLVESYVEDLCEINYPGIQAIYDELYTLKISFNVNTSEYDETTNMSAISKYDTRYYHFELTGLEKNESILISYIIYFTDGDTYTGEFEFGLTRDYNTSWVSAFFYTPAYAYAGTERVELYNKDTGELIGSKTVQITN